MKKTQADYATAAGRKKQVRRLLHTLSADRRGGRRTPLWGWIALLILTALFLLVFLSIFFWEIPSLIDLEEISGTVTQLEYRRVSEGGGRSAGISREAIVFRLDDDPREFSYEEDQAAYGAVRQALGQGDFARIWVYDPVWFQRLYDQQVWQLEVEGQMLVAFDSAAAAQRFESSLIQVCGIGIFMPTTVVLAGITALKLYERRLDAFLEEKAKI